MDFRTKIELPLGIRNNNPGNLRPGDKWLGMVDVNKGFIRFSDIAYGIRAWLINYRTQIAVRGIKNVGDFVKKYAPASENNVGAYLAAIKLKTGLTPTSPLPQDKEGVKQFMRAVFLHENGAVGSVHVTDAHIEEAFKRLSAIQRTFFLF